MKITTIAELKQNSYLMQQGELITFPNKGFAKIAFTSSPHFMEYNYTDKIVVFHDEEENIYVVPFFKGIIELLDNNDYQRNEKLYIPLSSSPDLYPEFNKKWKEIKNKIKLIN